MRQLISIILPLVLPTLLYFFYVSVVRRQAGPIAARLEEAPWMWLGAAGGLLLVVTLGAVALFGGADPTSVYEPARVIDGKIVPGHFE